MRQTCVVANSTYSYIVSELPGNPDIAVLHGLYLCEGPGGHNTQALKQRVERLKALGYSAVIATVYANNPAETSSLVACGFVPHSIGFKSRRTTHQVSVYLKNFNDT